MASDFDNLPTEVRLMIYSYLLSGRRFRLSTRPNPTAVPSNTAHLITSMLLVSKLRRAEATDAVGMYATFVIPRVSNLQAFRRDAPVHRYVRRLNIRLDRKNIKPKSMDKSLSLMPALREVTISERAKYPEPTFLNVISATKFRSDLRRCQDVPWKLLPPKLTPGPDPRRSLEAAFMGDNWCCSVLDFGSALHQRPGLKIMVEVDYTVRVEVPRRPSFFREVMRYFFQSNQQPQLPWIEVRVY